VYSRTRILDHKKANYHIPGFIIRVEYDPHRSAFLALVMYASGLLVYCLQAHGVTVGSRVVSYLSLYNVFFGGVSTHFSNGDSCNLQNTPQGSVLFDLERYPGSGGCVSRSAGTFCVLLKKFSNLRRCLLQLPSRVALSFSFFCTGTKGVSSNDTHMSSAIGNAGRARRLGRKSVVRGVAQNPVDHAHGGGEGKKSKMCFPRTA
jgi:large subunit ribosomal protein L2